MRAIYRIPETEDEFGGMVPLGQLHVSIISASGAKLGGQNFPDTRLGREAALHFMWSFVDQAQWECDHPEQAAMPFDVEPSTDPDQALAIPDEREAA